MIQHVDTGIRQILKLITHDINIISTQDIKKGSTVLRRVNVRSLISASE